MASDRFSNDELLLRQASQEQYLTSLSRHAPHWGTGLTTEQYFKREEALRATAACQDGRFQCWVLVSKTFPDSLEFYCSCETMRREVICTIGPQMSRPAIFPAYSICSVFCPAPNRKKGYAHQMMSLLHSRLGSLSWPESTSIHAGEDIKRSRLLLSFLYSDVGPEFYAKAGPPGWFVKESVETVWQVDEELVRAASQASSLGLEPIHLSNFAEVAELDFKWLHQQLAKPVGKQSAQFAIRPNGSELEWLVTRSNAHASFLRSSTLPELPTVIIWGYRMRQMMSEFVTWFIDYPAKVLYLTRVKCQVTNLEFLKGVFQKAVELARQQNCTKIKCWNLDSDLVTGLGLRCQNQPRTDSLSAVAWYGEKVDQVVWIANEKLFWC